MMQGFTREELLAKATKPSEDAMKLHVFYRGKMQILRLGQPSRCKRVACSRPDLGWIIDYDGSCG